MPRNHESIAVFGDIFAWAPDQIKLESAEVANTTSTQYGLRGRADMYWILEKKNFPNDKKSTACGYHCDLPVVRSSDHWHSRQVRRCRSKQKPKQPLREEERESARENESLGAVLESTTSMIEKLETMGIPFW